MSAMRAMLWLEAWSRFWAVSMRALSMKLRGVVPRDFLKRRVK